MKKVEIKIDGMSCDHCIMAVNKQLGRLDLDKAKVKIGSAKIKYDESKVTLDQINSAIEEAGYKVVN
jgi:copper chaperone